MAYVPIASVIPSFSDGNGDPLSGGVLYAYLAGTSTATNLYSDNAGTVLGTSVTLNSAGRPSSGGATTQIWLDDAVSYKFVLKDSEGVTLWTLDNVSPAASSAGSSASLAAYQADLASTSDTAKGDALIGVKREESGAQASTLHVWIKRSAIRLTDLVTGGSGTSADPWTGWETSLNGLDANKRIIIPEGVFSQSVVVNPKFGWMVEGQGYLNSSIQVVGAIQGWVYAPASLTEANIHLAGFRLLGDESLSLDLVSFTKATRCTIEHMNIRSTTKSAIRLDDNCINWAIKDSTVESYGEYGVYATNFSSVLTIDNLLSNANAKAGIAVIGLAGSEGINIRGLNANGTALTGNVLRGAWSRLRMQESYAEGLTGSAVAATALTQQTLIENCNLATGNSITLDFSASSLAHEDIVIRNVRNPVLPSAGFMFHPGSAVNFIYENSSLDTGSHINGYSGQSSVIKPRAGTLVLGGVKTLASGGTFTSGDTTPSVRGGEVFIASNSAATTITNFDDAQPGQEITLLAGNANTTVQYNANIYLAGSVNFAMPDNGVLRLLRNPANTAWYEIARKS